MIDDYVRVHDGVITIWQAETAGMHREAVQRRVRSGRWRRLSPGVYFVDDRPFTDAARVRAGVWAYGRHATASGLAAAWWHGLMVTAPGTVEVTMPRSANSRAHEGTRLRRRDLDSADIVENRGLRVTALALTTVEAAARRGGGPAVMDTALQRHTDLPPLWQAHLRNKGRYGSPRARMLLQGAADGSRSAAERLLVRLFNSAGITGWSANHAVCGYVVDFAFSDAKVIVEIDGWAFHSDQAAFQNDRVRQNVLMLNGWTVLRFTWRDLVDQPERVIAAVRRAISG
ncbi:MAG TPA: DUF559 domain-containing protein [Mycobacterium sp.]|nr:DUF559 domain-containing protein [Mycobacterium sp.]